MIPKLHVVTDDEILSRRDFLFKAREVLETGREEIVLHLRGPRTSGRELFSLASSLLPLAQATGSLLLANDRVDLALALGLPGAHLGQRSLSPDVARELLGAQRILGLSVHGAQEAGPWDEDDLDFLIVGNVFATSSHSGRAPGGMGRIREVDEVTRLPLVAIGGVSPRRVAEVLAAGAFGVAARGGIWDAEDPTVATEAYLVGCRVSEKGRGT